MAVGLFIRGPMLMKILTQFVTQFLLKRLYLYILLNPGFFSASAAPIIVMATLRNLGDFIYLLDREPTKTDELSAVVIILILINKNGL